MGKALSSRSRRKLGGRRAIGTKKSPRRIMRALGMIVNWLFRFDLANLAFAFLATLLFDVLQKRPLVNPKR
jgi:hypothetical protein